MERGPCSHAAWPKTVVASSRRRSPRTKSRSRCQVPVGDCHRVEEEVRELRSRHAQVVQEDPRQVVQSRVLLEVVGWGTRRRKDQLELDLCSAAWGTAPSSGLRLLR